MCLEVQAVTLRRMKNDMYDGKPLIELPPKTVTVEQLRFSEQEDAIYAAFEEKSRLDFKEYLRVGFGANYSHILVRTMATYQLSRNAEYYLDVLVWQIRTP